MNRSVAAINIALDMHCARQRRRYGTVKNRSFTCARMGDLIRSATKQEPDPAWTSLALQTYRKHQGYSGQCDYVIVCQGRGPASTWVILSGPGLDPIESEQLLLGHVEWVSGDLALRAANDIANELVPGAMNTPAVRRLIQTAADTITDALTNMGRTLAAGNELYEQATNRTVIRPAGIPTTNGAP